MKTNTNALILALLMVAVSAMLLLNGARDESIVFALWAILTAILGQREDRQ